MHWLLLLPHALGSIASIAWVWLFTSREIKSTPLQPLAVPRHVREWQVLIGSQENRPQSVGRIEWFCTGVLISHAFVISLAECGFASM